VERLDITTLQPGQQFEFITQHRPYTPTTRYLLTVDVAGVRPTTYFTTKMLTGLYVAREGLPMGGDDVPTDFLATPTKAALNEQIVRHSQVVIIALPEGDGWPLTDDMTDSDGIIIRTSTRKVVEINPITPA
jgi:hypothetical protein